MIPEELHDRDVLLILECGPHPPSPIPCASNRRTLPQALQGVAIIEPGPWLNSSELSLGLCVQALVGVCR